MKNFKLLFNTIKYLKSKQIYYRSYYLIRRKLKGFNYPLSKHSNPQKLNFGDFINSYTSFKDNVFTFLNLSKKFDIIDWNFKDYGKLWTYNLNYFAFLNQKDITKEEGLKLIENFIENIKNIRDGLEAYPISLRGINWIKFLSKNRINDKRINDSLYAQYYLLLDNIEYHLLGNHLLENGFSLLFGAYYFRDEVLYKKAKEILINELNEQVLSDGGHFEQSPMYHQILLERLLDSINLVKNNSWKNYELLEFLEEKASSMLSWIKNITFSNGSIPLFNDSAFNVAPTTKELLDYAQRLNIQTKNIPLGESGYRLIRKNNYEIAIDIADIKASYISGHTHADVFTFELYLDGKPIIVDTGISTYENNHYRYYERSTKAHNTIVINNDNSSEVWGSFRLGERAKVNIEQNTKDKIIALHDGYKRKYGVLHKREFSFYEKEIIIKDIIIGNNSQNAQFILHFHPSVNLHLAENKIIIDNRYVINLDKVKNIKVLENYYAPEFNKRKKNKVLMADFEREMECQIKTK